MSCVVITGSTEGIGFGLAREFCQRGFNVVVSSRSQTKVDAALEQLATLPGQTLGLTCDVADPAQVEALWQSSVDAFGTVDIWINNAGLARTTWPIAEVPQDQIEAMLHTNVLGGINSARVALAGMREQGQGKYFAVLGGGSDGEYFPGLGLYGTTKRALDYLINALVKENAGNNLVIGKIRPGMVITEAVVREAKVDPGNFEASRATMNKLVDQVETVSPYLVDQILATDKSGRKIRWLTPAKITGRMLAGMFRKREDQFERHGL